MFRKTCFAITASFLCLQGMSQTFDLEERTPYMDNGFEYGFIIKNEQIKKAGDEEYSRYEITFYVTNKSSCNKIYQLKNSSFSYDYPSLLATFNCRNANGKRFTSKSGSVKARELYTSIKRKEGDKEITEQVKAGYIFRNGETLRDNVIVLVPKGERPQVQCSVNSPQELD